MNQMAALDQAHTFLNKFSVAGINYRKSDVSIRGKFFISPEHSILLLKRAAEKEFPGCMVLSTCNRTEIYGICDHPHELIRSEERRVGKECRSGWSQDHYKNK